MRRMHGNYGSGNPWGTDGEERVVTGTVRLGTLPVVLSLAEATGHISTAERDESFEAPEMGGPGAGRADGAMVSGGARCSGEPSPHPSLQVIRAATELLDAHRDALAAEAAAHRERTARTARDVAGSGTLVCRVATLRELAAQLASIQTQIDRLEARVAGKLHLREHVPVRADLHESLVSLVNDAGSSLASTSTVRRTLLHAHEAINGAISKRDR